MTGLRVVAAVSTRVRTAVAAGIAAMLLAACSSGAPSDEPSPSSTRSLTPATVAKYPRTAPGSAFADPATLDVCAIAASTGLSGAGPIRLSRPDVADAAGCTLSSGSTLAGGTSSSISVTVRDQGPAATGAYAARLRRVLLPGAGRIEFVRDAKTNTCASAVGIRGVRNTWVLVANTGVPSGTSSTQACELSARIATRFYIASRRGASLPRVPIADPSLLSVDVCKAVAAGQVVRAIGFSGTPTTTAYGTGCLLRDASGSVQLSSGTIRSGAPTEGSPRVVDGHRMVLLPSNAPDCAVRYRRGGEVVTASFTGSGQSAPADCGVAARALAAYLDAVAVT